MHERRRHRLDRTDHIREREVREHRRRGPSSTAISDALEAIEAMDVPGTPRVGVARTLRDGVAFPVNVSTRTVKSAAITGGRPDHGALRSDDHISRFEVVLPFAEVNNDAVPVSECPECGFPDAVYTYSAHHHMSYAESVVCDSCGAEAYGDDTS
jgi:hypothetical protein